ncbi:MAG: hypothetical protein ACRENS_00920 [Candidatus Eiseniibacteriota bacterium]
MVTLLALLIAAAAPPARAAPAAHAAAHPAPGKAPERLEVAAWRSDLKLLARELPNRHPAPFLHLSHAQWDSACASLERRLPALTRDQAMVGFMQLVALIGDAHTVMAPDSALGLRFYPLELYAFEDGLFVRRADAAHADLVGAEVLSIGRVSADAAMTLIASVIPHENDQWVRAWGPSQLMIPEMLHGLGVAAEVERLPLAIQRAGRVDTVIVSPAGRIAEQHAHGPFPIEMSDWTSMRSAPAPWWEQHPGEPMWWMFDSRSKSLYVCMREVSPAPQSATNRSQWDQVFALADSVQPARLVIDVRENTGGNGGLNRYPVQQILRRPAIDRPDRLFVIIGRMTFSAAQQFTNLLEAWTRATLVGEPTGQRPSQYGDHRPLRLPGIGMTAQISSVFHQAPNEFDTRSFVPPRLFAPLTSQDYRQGIDPAMTAVLSPDTSGAISDRIEHALAAGDSAGAEQALQAARDALANRYRPFEREVNALGYRLLAAGQTVRALQAFRLNTRAYPRSANTFDSLGEALLGAGHRDDAIAAYRTALEIEPGFTPSAQVLERLGVHP